MKKKKKNEGYDKKRWNNHLFSKQYSKRSLAGDPEYQARNNTTRKNKEDNYGIAE